MIKTEARITVPYTIKTTPVLNPSMKFGNLIEVYGLQDSSQSLHVQFCISYPLRSAGMFVGSILKSQGYMFRSNDFSGLLEYVCEMYVGQACLDSVCAHELQKAGC